MDKNMFQTDLNVSDPLIAEAIASEGSRQAEQIELIASENIVSKAVLQAQGSLLTNKYAEGYEPPRVFRRLPLLSRGAKRKP